MLDDRKAAILRAVVEEYIHTAQPVGSAHIARGTGVGVSAATVRHEMAALERDGFLVHPHTSAGRVPTDKGYRFFVDQLSPGALPAPQKQRVQEFFAQAHGELEQMLFDTSRLLSDLTSYSALVVAPPREEAAVLSVHLVVLGARTALAVAVRADGSVEKALVEKGLDVTEAQLASAAAHLNAELTGRPVPDNLASAPSGDETVDRLVAGAVAALRAERTSEPEQVFVGGTAQLAAMFDAVDSVRQVLAILEQQYVVVSLLREALHDDRLSVSIGAEHGLEPLADCSLVVAPYGSRGAGTIGILGPTRMNYPQAIAAVAVVSQRLGHHLHEGPRLHQGTQLRQGAQGQGTQLDRGA